MAYKYYNGTGFKITTPNNKELFFTCFGQGTSYGFRHVCFKGKLLLPDKSKQASKRTGYKLLSRRNLNEIMCCGNEDYNHLYYDGFNVYKEAIHHDGTNHIMFREVRPDVNIEKLCDMIYNNEVISRATLNKYTRSLRRYVKKIYGW